MKDLLCDGFQHSVAEVLVRHKSILDVLTKLQEASTRTNRAVAKAVTSCGCLRISAERQRVPHEIPLAELAKHMETHLEGELCESCQEVIESEIGTHLFYVAALCNLMGLNFYDVLLKEHKKIQAFGPFNLS